MQYEVCVDVRWQAAGRLACGSWTALPGACVDHANGCRGAPLGLRQPGLPEGRSYVGAGNARKIAVYTVMQSSHAGL